MKKIFTLTVLFMLIGMGGVNAQSYRKWDFTNWSAQTIADLREEATEGGMANGKWSDIEKNTTEVDKQNPTNGNCFWSYANNVSAEGYLMANGHVIAETEGLVWNTGYTTKRSLAIAVNYPSTSIGTYNGPQYLWLGGGKGDPGKRVACFTIPKVKIGQKIVIVAESHNTTATRGVALFANDCNVEANKIGESFTPKTIETKIWEEGWTLPSGVEGNEDGETVDIVVWNTDGCHLYSIEIGEASEKSKIGYIYNGDYSADLAFGILGSIANYEIEPVEATATITRDVLAAYDAIVISASVNNAEAIASLKDIRPFVPTLNLNPVMYTVWEMGTLSDSGLGFADVKNTNHALFRDLEIVDEDGFKGLPLSEGTYQAVTLAGQFANDVVLATTFDQEATAIHEHNMSHNGYIYIPAIDGANPALVTNAIKLLVNSKSKVTTAPKPTITLDYKDMNTNVVLTSSVPFPVIYYTIDGSEPTEASTLYTEPFNISNAGVTVKAVVKGEGYLLSEVAETEVDLRKQAPMPEINLTIEDGKTIVTFRAIEGADVYYNYDGNNDTIKSSKYYADSLSVVVTKAKTIYAFTVMKDYVNSELASKYVGVQNPKVRIDVLAHMDANTEEYYEKSNKRTSSAGYFFSWGNEKANYPFYVLDSRKEESGGIDPETGDEIVNVTYTEMSPEETVDFENGWAIRSRGQLVISENLSATGNIGDTNDRNPATVDDINPDFPITKYFLNLADKNTTPADGQGFPYNAYIVTTEKHAGPFDVVANIGNGAGEISHLNIVFEVSTDGNVWESNWQTLGDTIEIFNGQRLYRNFTRSYEGTDEVYVRIYLCANNSKAQIYDVYIANAGEKSQEYLTGIEEVKQETTKTVPTAIYSLNGMRQQGLQRGINIVRQADGTVKKVLVK